MARDELSAWVEQQPQERFDREIDVGPRSWDLPQPGRGVATGRRGAGRAERARVGGGPRYLSIETIRASLVAVINGSVKEAPQLLSASA
jgi:hypothetical protein